MYKLLKILAYVLGILGFILFGGVLFSGVDPWADFLFFVAFALLGVALLAVLFYGFLNIVSSPQKLKKTLLYVGAFLVVLLVSYLFSSGDTSTDRVVGMGIVAVYILGAAATLLMVLSGVKKALIK